MSDKPEVMTQGGSSRWGGRVRIFQRGISEQYHVQRYSAAGDAWVSEEAFSTLADAERMATEIYLRMSKPDRVWY